MNFVFFDIARFDALWHWSFALQASDMEVGHMAIEQRLEHLEREAFVGFLDWLAHLRGQGVELERIAVPLGAPCLTVRSAVSQEWHRESVLRMIWSVMGDRLGAMDGARILRWAEDVEIGEQLGCLGKIGVMKNAEGFDGAHAGAAFGVVAKIRAARDEAMLLADLEAAHIERDAAGYAARLASCVRRVDADGDGGSAEADEAPPLEC